MNYNILLEYIKECLELDVIPTFEGLKRYAGE